MQKRVLLIILGLLIFGTWINTPNANATTDVTIAAGSDNGNVYVYNQTGTLLWSYATGADVVSVAVSSDGAYIAVGSLRNKLFLFDRSGTKLWEKDISVSYGGTGRGEESKSVAIPADAGYVVAGCTDALYVYKKDGSLHWSHTGQETCVGISTNGSYVVSCDKSDGTVHLFSITSSTPLWTKTLDAFWVAVCNTGHAVVSSSATGYMFDSAGTQLWSYVFDRGQYVRVDMPWDDITAIAVNDDALDVACYVWYFDVNGLVWKYTPCPPEMDFYSGSISGDGNIIAMGPGPMVGIYVYSSSGASLQNITTGDIHSVDITFDGKFGACGDRAGKLWYFSKDSSTPLWSKTIGGNVHTVSVAQVVVIPTLTEWGLIIFGVVLLGFISWVFLRRRRVASVRV